MLPEVANKALLFAQNSDSDAIVELDSLFGDACVHRGTIPSKTLRENALRVKICAKMMH
jgi:NAD(P) transhydrogenase